MSRKRSNSASLGVETPRIENHLSLLLVQRLSMSCWRIDLMVTLHSDLIMSTYCFLNLLLYCAMILLIDLFTYTFMTWLLTFSII